jgi:hypothetical protein
MTAMIATDPNTIATQLINAQSFAEADAIGATLKGKTLAVVADLLGVHLYGTTDQRRQIVVRAAIGAALDSAAIRYYDDPAARDVFLADYRARRIASLGEDLV